jgi:hypothetical protein
VDVASASGGKAIEVEGFRRDRFNGRSRLQSLLSIAPAVFAHVRMHEEQRASRRNPSRALVAKRARRLCPSRYISL